MAYTACKWAPHSPSTKQSTSAHFHPSWTLMCTNITKWRLIDGTFYKKKFALLILVKEFWAFGGVVLLGNTTTTIARPSHVSDAFHPGKPKLVFRLRGVSGTLVSQIALLWKTSGEKKANTLWTKLILVPNKSDWFSTVQHFCCGLSPAWSNNMCLDLFICLSLFDELPHDFVTLYSNDHFMLRKHQWKHQPPQQQC